MPAVSKAVCMYPHFKPGKSCKSACLTLHVLPVKNPACLTLHVLPDKACTAVQHMSKESQRVARYRTRMEVVDKWMAKRHLPLKLRSRIGHYYAEVCSCQTACIALQQKRSKVLGLCFHQGKRCPDTVIDGFMDSLRMSGSVSQAQVFDSSK